MNYETKRKIIKVTAGVAITAALALGIAFGGPAIKDSIQYNNTNVTYNNSDYALKDLYLLTNDAGESTLCYAKAIDSETVINFGSGINMGSGIMIGTNGSVGFSTSGSANPGSLVMGITTSSNTIYGFLTLDSNELIAIHGEEDQFGYKAESLKSKISFEVAKEKGFIITNDDLCYLLSMPTDRSK